MTAALLTKLLAIAATVALGWLAARRRWLGPLAGDPDAGRVDAAGVLGHAAFYLFVPALLFRTMAQQDLSALPLRTLAAYFMPAAAYALAVYTWQRVATRSAATADGAAAPATRTVAATYGNAVQLGIPMATALFGASGLALHLALVSVHGLVLLTLLTVLVERDLARGQGGSRWQTLASTARNAVLHPVVLPILAGLGWNLLGLPMPGVLDEALALLGSAVVPVCLVLIGASLASYGLRSSLRASLTVGLLKLLVLPALVLAVAGWGFGLQGQPLAVLVMMAALPVGNNALIFAQRYGVLQAEATLAIVTSTLAFGATAALWLSVLAALGA